MYATIAHTQQGLKTKHARFVALRPHPGVFRFHLARAGRLARASALLLMHVQLYAHESSCQGTMGPVWILSSWSVRTITRLYPVNRLETFIDELNHDHLLTLSR